VVTQRCHHHVFVGLSHSTAVDSLHIVVVNQRAQNRFYRTAPAFGQHSGVVFVAVQLGVHLVIQRFVDAVFYLFKLRYFSTTFRSQWTIFTVFFAATVAFLLIAFAVG